MLSELVELLESQAATANDSPASAIGRDLHAALSSSTENSAMVRELAYDVLLKVSESCLPKTRDTIEQRLLPLLPGIDVVAAKVLILHALCLRDDLKAESGLAADLLYALGVVQKSHVLGIISDEQFVKAAEMLDQRM